MTTITRHPMSPEEWDSYLRSPHATLAEYIELQAKDYAARVEIDMRETEFCSNGKYEVIRDEARRRLIHELRVRVFGKRHPEKTVVRYPADWWEAVKERFAPAWFLNRYPVRFTEVTATLDEMYPHLSQSIPKEEVVWHFHVRKEVNPYSYAI